jgi:IS30 family transposase
MCDMRDTGMLQDCLYLAEQAQHHGTKRRTVSHQPYQIEQNQLMDTVLTRSRNAWTPEDIGGRFPHGFPDDPRTRAPESSMHLDLWAR